jgi:uncharacterized protein (TIRG00374 family)
MKPKTILYGLFLSTLAWFAECTGLFLTINIGLKVFSDININLLLSSFIYSMSTLAGVISPGGIGITDASLIGFLSLYLNSSQALIASFIIRLATLWFAVFIGGISLLLFFKNILNNRIFNSKDFENITRNKDPNKIDLGED